MAVALTVMLHVEIVIIDVLHEMPHQICNISQKPFVKQMPVKLCMPYLKEGPVSFFFSSNNQNASFSFR